MLCDAKRGGICSTTRMSISWKILSVSNSYGVWKTSSQASARAQRRCSIDLVIIYPMWLCFLLCHTELRGRRTSNEIGEVENSGGAGEGIPTDKRLHLGSLLFLLTNTTKNIGISTSTTQSRGLCKREKPSPYPAPHHTFREKR